MKKQILLIFTFIIVLAAHFQAKSQNVGVSNAAGLTPQSLLHVHNSAAGRLFQLTNASTGNTANDGFIISIDGSSNIVFNQYETAKMSFYTSNTERLTILSGGNVGIGTVAPAQKLDVGGITQSTGYRTTSGNTNYHHFTRNGSGAAVYINQVDAVNPILRLSSGIETPNQNVVFTVENNGNVGIGTTTPSAQLHTSGTVRFQNYTNGFLQVDGNGNVSVGTGSALFTAGTGLTWNSTTLNSVWTASGNNIYNNNSGNVGIGTTSPSTKLYVAGDIYSELGIDHSIKSVAELQNNKTMRGGIYQNNGDGLYNSAGSALALTNWWHVINMHHQHNNGYNAQIAVPLSASPNDIFFRTSGGGTWSEWRKVLSENASGNVGIGTTNPSTTLDVNGVTNTATGYRVGGAATSGNYLRGNGTNFVSSAIQASDIPSLSGNYIVNGTTLQTANFNISGNGYIGGNVGIGTITPGYKLDVSGDIRSTNKIWANANGASYFRGGDDAELWDVNVANTFGIYGVQNSAVATIRLGSGSADISGSGGNIGIGTTSPAEKLDVSGNIRSTGNHFINNSSPTIYLQDNDHRSGMIHMNSNLLYFLSSNGTNSTTWTTNGSYWPMTINMTNDNITVGGSTFFMEGNVGIGTTSPASKLSVGGAGSNNYSIYSYSTGEAAVYGYGTGSGTYNIGLAGYAVSGSATDVGVYGEISNSAYDWAAVFVGDVWANNYYDIAEMYDDDGEIPSCALVSLSAPSSHPSKVRVVISSKPYDPNLVGIKSEKPGFYIGSTEKFKQYKTELKSLKSRETLLIDRFRLLNKNDISKENDAELLKINNELMEIRKRHDSITLSSTPKSDGDVGSAIALVGRVKVLACDENGPIHVGDPITSSSKPGYAMKATKPGPIVGFSFSELPSGEGKIVVNVNRSYYSPKDEKTTNILDFGTGIIYGNDLWINFSDDFMMKPDKNIPVVTVTPNNQGVVIFVDEVTEKGFHIKAENNHNGEVKFSWIAITKILK